MITLERFSEVSQRPAMCVGNGKRFMAYELVSKPEQPNRHNILVQLEQWVNNTDKARNKNMKYLSTHLTIRVHKC